MTSTELATTLAYPAHTVVLDATKTVWVKKWNTWQRPGSLGDYDSSAMVQPLVVLWEPGV